jgi:quercetin dioxygenase-like cupin family protein
MSETAFVDARALAEENETVIAVVNVGGGNRTTDAHSHACGQLLAPLNGLMAVGSDRRHWIVPAIHAVWVPPHAIHSMQSHGDFAGWSIYVADRASAALPDEITTIQTSALLREAVKRSAAWPQGLRSAQRDRLSQSSWTR